MWRCITKWMVVVSVILCLVYVVIQPDIIVSQSVYVREDVTVHDHEDTGL